MNPPYQPTPSSSASGGNSEDSIHIGVIGRSSARKAACTMNASAGRGGGDAQVGAFALQQQEARRGDGKARADDEPCDARRLLAPARHQQESVPRAADDRAREQRRDAPPRRDGDIAAEIRRDRTYDAVRRGSNHGGAIITHDDALRRARARAIPFERRLVPQAARCRPRRHSRPSSDAPSRTRRPRARTAPHCRSKTPASNATSHRRAAAASSRRRPCATETRAESSTIRRSRARPRMRGRSARRRARVPSRHAMKYFAPASSCTNTATAVAVPKRPTGNASR